MIHSYFFILLLSLITPCVAMEQDIELGSMGKSEEILSENIIKPDILLRKLGLDNNGPENRFSDMYFLLSNMPSQEYGTFLKSIKLDSVDQVSENKKTEFLTALSLYQHKTIKNLHQNALLWKWASLAQLTGIALAMSIFSLAYSV